MIILKTVMVLSIVLLVLEETLIKQNNISSMSNESTISSFVMLRLRVDLGFAPGPFMRRKP